MIITILPYNWGLLNFSEGHLQGYFFLWLFCRAEPLFNSSGSSPSHGSTYREWRVEFRERRSSIRVVESGGLIAPPVEVGACREGGSTTCGAVGTTEESVRLTGLWLFPPVATVLLADGTIIHYGGGGSSSPSGSCKISFSSLVIF